MLERIKGQIRSAGFLVFVCVMALVMTSTAGAGEGGRPGEGAVLETLKSRLVKDGFSRKRMDALFASDGVAMDYEGISLFFVHRESTLNYDRFLEENVIAKARRYLVKHSSSLDTVEKRYGVDKTVVTAIMLVETHLGSYVGKRPVLNTLATMSVLSDSVAREYVWKAAPKMNRLSRELFDKKADRKSNWAYGELKAFIKYTEKEKLAAHTIKGSYAGAMGICQFMPSRILPLAKDGNKDGRVDLFNHKDAMASVANYLKHFGWRPGIQKTKARRVIMKYNKSTYYANTVLKISEKLKG